MRVMLRTHWIYLSIFFIDFVPGKVVKPLRHKALLGGERLEKNIVKEREQDKCNQEDSI